MNRFEKQAREKLRPHWLLTEEGLVQDISDVLREVAQEAFLAGCERYPTFGGVTPMSVVIQARIAAFEEWEQEK